MTRPKLLPYDAQILALLSDAAAAGAPCPTNAELIAAVGLRSIASAAESVARLEAAGLIRAERTATQRRVTILATGETTDFSQGIVSRVTKEMLAEFIADGGLLSGAVQAFGVGRRSIDRRWEAIKADLGWQAYN